MAIETRYHVRIDIDEEKTKNPFDIDEKLGNLFFSNEIEDINVFEGNAACSPYIEFWCVSMKVSEKMEKKFIARLKYRGIHCLQ